MMSLGTVIVIADEHDASPDREKGIPETFRVVHEIGYRQTLNSTMMSSAVRTFSWTTSVAFDIWRYTPYPRRWWGARRQRTSIHLGRAATILDFASSRNAITWLRLTVGNPSRKSSIDSPLELCGSAGAGNGREIALAASIEHG